jgi:hypothetical protein
MTKMIVSRPESKESLGSSLKRLRKTQIAAGIAFVAGKVMFIPAGASLFIENRAFGHIAIGIYARLITLSILLCLIDFYILRRNDNEKLSSLAKTLGIPERELERKLTSSGIKL